MEPPEIQKSPIEKENSATNSQNKANSLLNPEQKSNSFKSNSSKSKASEWLTLTEDVFGKYIDPYGKEHDIKRYTWKNKNKIQVQVITYGARITSIKVPDRKGVVEDIVLGFDDLAGYIFYHNYYFGSTVGRMTNMVPDGILKFNKQTYNLTKNYIGQHHYNGGGMGLDQVVWNAYPVGKKVIMSHVSPHMSEGYPGDLLIRISFELSEKNEFQIDMNAFTSQPTVINLSNFTYFNLAGHYKGPHEIYKHVVTLNCNCFTKQVDGLPTGEIQNVANTVYDFQVPKVLGKLMGIVPKDGFCQNLCVNRGTEQGDCFISRILHPPTGRMVEIYSNQRGVNFSTANEFGYGLIQSMQDLIESIPSQSDNIKKKSYVLPIKSNDPTDEPYLILIRKIHEKVADELKKDEDKNYEELVDLIMKMRKNNESYTATPQNTANPTPSRYSANEENKLQEELESFALDLIITTHQKDYLEGMLRVICEEDDQEECEWLKCAVEKILQLVLVTDIPLPESQRESVKSDSQTKSQTSQMKSESTKNISKLKRPSQINVIPPIYKNCEQIVGKERVVYRMHSGIAIQTQNYPGCAYLKNFPNCVLNPGETYKHTITYKFWIRAGNPNKWIKRNLSQIAQKKMFVLNNMEPKAQNL